MIDSTPEWLCEDKIYSMGQLFPCHYYAKHKMHLVSGGLAPDKFKWVCGIHRRGLLKRGWAEVPKEKLQREAAAAMDRALGHIEVKK